MSLGGGFANLSVIEEMYAKYLQNPLSVDETWRKYFLQIDRTPIEIPKPSTLSAPLGKVPVPETIRSPESVSLPTFQFEAGLSESVRIFNLIQAYREFGHLMAHVNPIQTRPIEEPRELKLEILGFEIDELSKPFPTCGLLEQERAALQEIIDVLKKIYCGKIGVEYLGIDNPELEIWLQEQIEPSRFQIQLTIDQKQLILQHLNKSELFESFLHTKYVGQKRFSLEGGETLIPIMASIIERGSELGANEFVIGMAHRGRLNILSNILDKSYSTIFSEFEESYIPESIEGSGDVKYHKGFTSEHITTQGNRVKIGMAPNPSHLESVNPVVEGSVYAKNIQKQDVERIQTIPILVHGDAAISGQGIVYETMQLSQLEGYSTGGTIHIVINNQIGFTTLPIEGRSTHYCTDIAKAFDAPVFHVNAEDPESCIYATNLAVELRQRFHCDVFIDLVCYRKYGHNEGDEPAFTQPLEYQLIRKKKPIREIYRDDLIQQGVLEKYLAEELEEEFKRGLNQALKGTKDSFAKKETKERVSKPKAELFPEVKTGVALEDLQEMAERFCRIPADFHIHRKLKQLIENRRAMVKVGEGAKAVAWGMAELLAYASLLVEGTPVRISGQDCCRGTFSHRHAMWMDQKEERKYYPLKDFIKGQARFDIYNSALSEYAVLGFEYGYSISYSKTLVIWEAQFGDFANGAQVIIDQYLSTGEQKWGQKSNLVLLLPHGYEGQGPEHSSARIERFLTLSGNNNMTVVNPTTPAQLFHLLRRQIKQPLEKPLIIFSPKGLLRHPACVSAIEEFTKASFQEIIDDPAPPKDPKRIVFCNGRVFYDLLSERAKRASPEIAIIRIEQLYPLNRDRLKEVLGNYQNAEEYLWVQEEPSNMGAWNFIRPKLNLFIPNGKTILYVGRARSASPATGSLALHKKEFAAMMREIFPKEDESDMDVTLMHRV